MFYLEEKPLWYPQDINAILEQLDDVKWIIKRRRRDKGIKYANIAAALDTETSSVETIHVHERIIDGEVVRYTTVDDKHAWIYVWMVGINGRVIMGRRYEDLIDMLHRISEYADLSYNKRLVIYVHNLGYDWQFFRKSFEWVEPFALNERALIRGTTTTGLEFRCSYKLTNQSLSNMSKELSKYPVRKMDGDLDYSLVRLPITPLSDTEVSYCVHDVLVVMSKIQQEIEGDDRGILSIPLTQTAYVRDDLNARSIYCTDSKVRMQYKGVIRKLTLTPEQYQMLSMAMSGGAVAGQWSKIGRIIEDVYSLDETSAYPAMMCQKYPMTKFERVGYIKTWDDFEKLASCNDYAMLIKVSFKNLRPRVAYYHPMPSSKCYKFGADGNDSASREKWVKEGNWVLDNGKMVYGDEVGTVCTELDLLVYHQYYEWDSIWFRHVEVAKKGYLPKQLIEAMLDYYEAKTQLKGIDKRTDLTDEEKQALVDKYNWAKARLNSLYGCMVTRFIRPRHDYGYAELDYVTEATQHEWVDDDWTEFDTAEWLPASMPDITEAVEAYNNSKTRATWWAWGVWVTAYNRFRLWQAIAAVGDDFVYCDTDSVKFENYASHIKWFEDDNAKWVKIIDDCLKYHGIDPERARPKTTDVVLPDGTVKKGKPKQLGAWDLDGVYEQFVTLGAKRYAAITASGVTTTVAGCGKSLSKYLQLLADTHGGSPLDYFKPDLHVPAEYTDKQTHTYIDEPWKGEATDYLGNTCEVISPSCVHLIGCDYDFSSTQALVDHAIRRTFDPINFVGH